MKKISQVVILVFSLSLLIYCQKNAEWRDSFPVNKENLGPIGNNQYFILQPGYQLYYVDGNDTLITTILNETYVVDSVETRVVLDSKKVDGELIEVTRDYFVIDTTTHDVYYFGEDVDIYQNGQIVNHEGAWLSGINGAKFGLMMPGTVRVGDKYYQEIVPDIAMDRAEIISIDEMVETPAGEYQNCVHTQETSPLESGVSHKWYAHGVGMVKDEDFVLVRIVAP